MPDANQHSSVPQSFASSDWFTLDEDVLRLESPQGN